MLEINQVINALRNDEWHKLNEIVEKSKLSEVKVEIILKFLAEYGFVEINTSGQKVKISPSLQNFLEENPNLRK